MIARAALLALAVATPAVAHQAMSGMEYDRWCCSPVMGNEGDCAAIPASAVQITPDGYLATLTPEARESTDGMFHACVLPGAQQFRCLMVPRVDG